MNPKKPFPLLVALLFIFSVHSDEFCPQISEIAFVQLSFDGVNSFNCGVGTVVLQTKKILKELNEEYLGAFHSKLYLLTPDYSNELKEYSFNVLKENIMDCKTSGGDVFLLPTKKRDVFFGDPDQWEDVCDAGASICKEIINQNSYTVIIAHDTAFAQVPIRLKKLSSQGEIIKPYKILWVPHATSWSYNGHNGETPGWPERHHWELKAFQGAATHDYQIGYIGDTIKNDIMGSPFHVRSSQLFYYQTGIISDRYLDELPPAKIAEELKKRGIPLDKRLMFSIGRATPLKGQDIVLEMYHYLKPLYPDLHLVILAPESDHTPEFIDLLKKRNREEGLEATIIDHFDPDLNYYIYQWPKTSLVALLSRADTQPLTVMEARTNPKNSIVLVSNQGGMGAQVCDGKDGFVCEIDQLPPVILEPMPSCKEIQAIVQKARNVLDLPHQKRHEIIQNGKSLIRDKYDLRRAMISNLNQLLTDPTAELLCNQEVIKEQYGLSEPLVFKTLTGGIVNPAIGIWLENGTPVGVFKSELAEEEMASKRLELLDKMKRNGFPHLPAIYKNIEGRFLTKIGNTDYSLIEYLPHDPERSISFLEILELTGKFHQSSRAISPTFQALTKLEEYNLRASIFAEYKSILNEKIISLSEYFSSREFQWIFDSLPKSLIHGDNNFSNIIFSGQNPYFIDLDSARYDARILDLATLIRYGHFEEYLKDQDLFSTIDSTFGRFGGRLTEVEKRHFHEIVAFSHIEFMSWALTVLKEAESRNDHEQATKFQGYINLYVDQLSRMSKKKQIEKPSDPLS